MRRVWQHLEEEIKPERLNILMRQINIEIGEN